MTRRTPLRYAIAVPGLLLALGAAPTAAAANGDDAKKDEKATNEGKSSSGGGGGGSSSGVTLTTAEDELAQHREGLTVQAGLGFGTQTLAGGGAFDDTNVGFAGPNFGVGYFLSPDMALLFRHASTVTRHGVGAGGGFGGFGGGGTWTTFAGIEAAALQFWIEDYVKLEGGLGLGYAGGDDSDAGLGMLFGGRVPIWHTGPHTLQAGIEYHNAIFFDDTHIHSFSFVAEWQML